MFAVGLSACTSGGAARVEPAHVMLYDKARNCEVDRPDPAGIGPRKNGSLRPGAIALDCFRFPSSNPGKEFAYELALKSDLDRNRLAFVLLSQADTICIVEKSLMLERQAEVNGWLSIATTGLSVASTIVTGDQASNILSGGAAFTSGSRDHVNTHVYRNQIIQTVTTAIDTKRGEALADILTNLKKKKEEYSIDAAIRDVNAYHQLCSFGTGLQLVMEAVEKQAAYEEAIKLNRIDTELSRLERDLRTAGRTSEEGKAIITQMNALREARILRSTDVDLNPPDPDDATGQVVTPAPAAPGGGTPVVTPDPAAGGDGDGEAEGDAAAPDGAVQPAVVPATEDEG